MDLIACAHLFPPHPAKDALGVGRPFDHGRHLAFQGTLHAFGNPELVRLKERVVAMVKAGEPPPCEPVASSRMARASVRVALRQLKALDAQSPSLSAWVAVYESSMQASAGSKDSSEVEEHA